MYVIAQGMLSEYLVTQGYGLGVPLPSPFTISWATPVDVTIAWSGSNGTSDMLAWATPLAETIQWAGGVL